VSSLDATPLKPDAASLEASLDWDPDDEDDGSSNIYTRGGAALAQMLRGLTPPTQAINDTAVQNFKTPVSKERKAEVGDQSISGGQTGGKAKGRAGGGRGKAGWNGLAKVVDAGAVKAGSKKGAAKEGAGKKGGRGRKRVEKEDKEVAGHGVSGELEELTEEEQLAQAIAASLGDDLAPSKSSSTGKRRKRGGKTEPECGGGEETAAERRRKGDAEMEMQLQIAMAATAIEAALKPPSPVTPSAVSRLARGEAPVRSKGADARVSDAPRGLDVGAAWSRRRGPALHWAEVYCGGGKEGGRWVHVDPCRGVVDAPEGVEAAAAGAKQPLRYVVAFAGGGAKDITRR
jgi:hypothetical protein